MCIPSPEVFHRTLFQYLFLYVVVYRTKIPDPPIHFSGPPIFFGPKNEFTRHQFETRVLDPPMSSDPLSTLEPPNSGKGTGLWLNFYEGHITVSEFVKDVERGKFDVENDRRGSSPGSTCSSVVTVPPDCTEHIPPSLGVHPVTDS